MTRRRSRSWRSVPTADAAGQSVARHRRARSERRCARLPVWGCGLDIGSRVPMARPHGSLGMAGGSAACSAAGRAAAATGRTWLAEGGDEPVEPMDSTQPTLMRSLRGEAAVEGSDEPAVGETISVTARASSCRARPAAAARRRSRVGRHALGRRASRRGGSPATPSARSARQTFCSSRAIDCMRCRASAGCR